MSEVRRTSDMSEVKLDEVLVELYDLKAKYAKALYALKVADQNTKDKWHHDVCEKTGECCCNTRFTAVALAELGEKE